MTRTDTTSRSRPTRTGGVGLLCLALTWGGAEAVQAQDVNLPEEMFESLIGQGTPIDAIRDEIAFEYGSAVATDLVVWWCSPDPGAGCEGSEVKAAWDLFLQGLNEGDSVDQVASVMGDYYDPYLVEGIAAWWCSPEAGYGCVTDSPYYQAWHWFEGSLMNDPNPAHAIERIAQRSSPLLAELVAASICGEPTCYAELLVDFTEPVAPSRSLIPQPVARPGSAGMQFDTPPKQPVDKRAALCAAGVPIGCQD